MLCKAVFVDGNLLLLESELVLQLLDADEGLLLVDSELLLPAIIEVLHVLIANLHILPHLRILDVSAELVLVDDDLLLDCSHLFHQVLVELILLHFAAFFSEELHFLLDA